MCNKLENFTINVVQNIKQNIPKTKLFEQLLYLYVKPYDITKIYIFF